MRLVFEFIKIKIYWVDNKYNSILKIINLNFLLIFKNIEKLIKKIVKKFFEQKKKINPKKCAIQSRLLKLFETINLKC